MSVSASAKEAPYLCGAARSKLQFRTLAVLIVFSFSLSVSPPLPRVATIFPILFTSSMPTCLKEARPISGCFTRLTLRRVNFGDELEKEIRVTV